MRTKGVSRKVMHREKAVRWDVQLCILVVR